MSRPGPPPPCRRCLRRGAGYVELLVAFLLVGLVATVAIPQYLQLRRKAMRAEPLPNLRSIGVAQQAWHVAQSTWVAADWNPRPPVGRLARDFERDRGDWSPLGWYPEGQVRCTYAAVPLDQGRHVRADAICDLDADRHVAIFRYEVPAGDQAGAFLDLYPERF